MMIFPILQMQHKKKDLLIHSMMKPIIRPSQPEHLLCHQFTKKPYWIGHLNHLSLWSHKRPPAAPLMPRLAKLSNKPLNGNGGVKIWHLLLQEFAYPPISWGLVGPSVCVAHRCCHWTPLFWTYLVLIIVAERILVQEDCWSNSMGEITCLVIFIFSGPTQLL